MAAAPKSADSQESVQAAVFKLLGDPATYGGAAVRRCETHAAVVFLAGDRAIKVKRAVRYPFLDYSTLAKREAACRAELEVNRKFAPQLYRRIVPIVRQADGSLALDGAGEAVEWAVEMTRFDEDNTLDHLAERGELGDALTGKLAVAVAAMHARAEPVEAAPWLAAIAGFIPDNTAAFREHGELFPAQAVDELERKSQAALAKLLPLLSARGAAGLIRRGHGDLHLGNIAVLDGEPIAFDALEFDPIIAEGDVLYDLAFLLDGSGRTRACRRRECRAERIFFRVAARAKIATASPRCRSSCRCAQRSAPRSPPRAAISPAPRTKAISRGRHSAISISRSNCFRPRSR